MQPAGSFPSSPDPRPGGSTITAYTLVKFLHVLAAVVAVGANATYGLWLGRAARDPRHLPFALRGVKVLDDFVANPAYVLLLVTGVGLVTLGSIPWGAFWIVASLVLYGVAVVLGLLVYTPLLRRQLQVLERRGAASDEYRALSIRGATVGIALAVVVVTILFLMVTKPQPF